MLYRTHICREPEFLITNILKENVPSRCGRGLLSIPAAALLPAGFRTEAAQMRAMFRFPDCFLSQITYFQQVELLLKEERKAMGFFSKHAVYVLPGMPREQARFLMFLLFRAVILSSVRC